MTIKELKFESKETERILEQAETIYQTKFWLNFLILESCGTPVILELNYSDKAVYFVGLIFKKFFFKMCGSPFEGWSTPYMGFINFDSLSENEKLNAIKETKKYLFKTKHVVYFELADPSLNIQFCKNNSFRYEERTTLILDINKSEDDLFSNFKKDVRTNCRNFYKRGCELKIVKPSIEFGTNYYNQLVDVFDKQNLKSYYSLDKILNLMTAFKQNPDLILCEEVVLENNNCVATGIFLGYKKIFYFFGAASYRQFQILRPNENVIWNAIKYWKSKGCITFDMCGYREYKKKFSPFLHNYPVIYFSRFPFLHFFKKCAKKILLKKRRLK